jgi:hypothetical protein
MDATALLLLTKLEIALGWSDDELRAAVEELVHTLKEDGNG